MQRFGSSANLHSHLHTRALDGVFVEADGEIRFVLEVRAVVTDVDTAQRILAAIADRAARASRDFQP